MTSAADMSREVKAGPGILKRLGDWISANSFAIFMTLFVGSLGGLAIYGGTHTPARRPMEQVHCSRPISDRSRGSPLHTLFFLQQAHK